MHTYISIIYIYILFCILTYCQDAQMGYVCFRVIWSWSPQCWNPKTSLRHKSGPCQISSLSWESLNSRFQGFISSVEYAKSTQMIQKIYYIYTDTDMSIDWLWSLRLRSEKRSVISCLDDTTRWKLQQRWRGWTWTEPKVYFFLDGELYCVVYVYTILHVL